MVTRAKVRTHPTALLIRATDGFGSSVGLRCGNGSIGLGSVVNMVSLNMNRNTSIIVATRNPSRTSTVTKVARAVMGRKLTRWCRGPLAEGDD